MVKAQSEINTFFHKNLLDIGFRVLIVFSEQIESISWDITEF